MLLLSYQTFRIGKGGIEKLYNLLKVTLLAQAQLTCTGKSEVLCPNQVKSQRGGLLTTSPEKSLWSLGARNLRFPLE